MSGPRNAEDRLRRLLVMLPWLMETGEVPLAEVARRFDMTETQVQSDLELVAMCGLPPFIDEMIDVFVDDGVVFVGVPRLFTRPLRLTAPEAFSLLASARAAMQLPGADRRGDDPQGLHLRGPQKERRHRRFLIPGAPHSLRHRPLAPVLLPGPFFSRPSFQSSLGNGFIFSSSRSGSALRVPAMARSTIRSYLGSSRSSLLAAILATAPADSTPCVT